MKRLVLFLLSVLTLLLCISLASARTYHMTLLTIGELEDDPVGGTANVFLEVTQGTGRIFLDSFPLTKIDTQISTRYANEVACDFLDKDCSRYDFFYTIRAGSTIVGGPSASAPLAILTIAALEGLELDQKVVMTGTINSGGSIGPVGGVYKKAAAAEKAGFKKVLIPLFAINLEEKIDQTHFMNKTLNITAVNETNKTNATNETQDVPSIEETNLSIEVVKVSNIEEALAHFTQNPARHVEAEIKVPDDYTSTMKEVATNLCNRALELHKKTVLTDAEINKSGVFIININKSLTQESYYSAASYCFSLGVLLRKANLKEVRERHPEQINKLYDVTKKAVSQFSQNLDKKDLTTLAELETYIIVKERLVESQESLVKVANNISTDELAYAVERYYSGVYWSNFFRIQGEALELDQEFLRNACFKKLSEAEERINYASIYIPLTLQNAQNTIKQAYAFSVQENYKMCLFKASFAKAESNLLLSSIAVEKEQIEELVDEKLKAAKKVILKEQIRSMFPILGYSYYEYANSLKENGDAVSGLIFGEYALELSNIEIYFPKKGFKLPNFDYGLLFLFISIFLFGAVIGIVTSTIKFQRKAKKEKRVQSKTKKKKRSSI